MTEGYLTAHVLDTYNGKPGNGIDIELYSIENERIKIKSLKLNNSKHPMEFLGISSHRHKKHT